jgi:hypothetical protein
MEETPAILIEKKWFAKLQEIIEGKQTMICTFSNSPVMNTAFLCLLWWVQ